MTLNTGRNQLHEKDLSPIFFLKDLSLFPVDHFRTFFLPVHESSISFFQLLVLFACDFKSLKVVLNKQNVYVEVWRFLKKKLSFMIKCCWGRLVILLWFLELCLAGVGHSGLFGLLTVSAVG